MFSVNRDENLVSQILMCQLITSQITVLSVVSNCNRQLSREEATWPIHVTRGDLNCAVCLLTDLIICN